jgi:hypothetical protein
MSRQARARANASNWNGFFMSFLFIDYYFLIIIFFFRFFTS